MVKLEEKFNNQYNILYESYKQNYIESAQPINLSDCKEIITDVIDTRNELETNYCLLYNDILTRVQTRLILIKQDSDGLKFLGKRTRFAFQLPDGGYDGKKDSGNIINTAIRELKEESNISIKNVRDSGIAYWKYREDPFVNNHVANPDDRWYGYYTFILTAEYDGESDNNNPEEIGKWKWLPIDLINKGNKYIKQAFATIHVEENLDEAWGNEHGEYDYTESDKLSNCVENQHILRLVLENNSLKISNATEPHETDIYTTSARGRIKAGQTKKKYHFVSFSEQLFSHAWRKPEKWGFGIVVDKASLEQKYSLTFRDHEYKSIRIKGVIETTNNNYFLRTDAFGTVPLTKQSFNWLHDDITNYSKHKQQQVGDTVCTKGDFNGIPYKQLWEVRDSISTSKRDNATSGKVSAYLEDSEKIKYNYGFSCPSDSYSMPFTESPHYNDILAELIDNTWFNEGEQRVWVKDDSIKYLDLDNVKIVGIILPACFEDSLKIKEDEDFEFINNYIIHNNLKIYWHHAYSPSYLKLSKLLTKYNTFNKSINQEKYNSDIEYRKQKDKEKKKLYTNAYINAASKRRYRDNPEVREKMKQRTLAYQKSDKAKKTRQEKNKNPKVRAKINDYTRNHRAEMQQDPEWVANKKELRHQAYLRSKNKNI